MRVPLTSEIYGSDGKLSREWFSFFSDLAKAAELDATLAFDPITPIPDPANLGRRNLFNEWKKDAQFDGKLAIGQPVNSAGAAAQVLGSVDVTINYRVAGITVVGAQLAAIAAPVNTAANSSNTAANSTNTASGSAGAAYTSAEQNLINALGATVASQQTAITNLVTTAASQQTAITKLVTTVTSQQTAITTLISRLQTHGLTS